MKFDKQTTHLCRYHFSEKEKQELAVKLAERNQDVRNFEEDKKRVTSEFKAKIDAATAEIGSLSNKVTSGYEMRDIKCGVLFNTPFVGVKRTIRLDTDEIVSEEEMNDFEKQAVLKFEEEEVDA